MIQITKDEFERANSGKPPTQYNHCECWFHRYHLVHICTCGEIIDHSQGTWDEHKNHIPRPGLGFESFPSIFYQHDDKPEDLRERFKAFKN